MEIDETVCYDIQMVTGNMINKRILQDYGFDVDDSLITKERSDRLCSVCPFNQLMQTAHVVGKTATA
jgi:hypothetical protein